MEEASAAVPNTTLDPRGVLEPSHDLDAGVTKGMFLRTVGENQ